MNDIVEFLTSREIIVVYVIVAVICLIAFLIYLFSKNTDKRKQRQNTRKLNRLVEDVNAALEEEGEIAPSEISTNTEEPSPEYNTLEVEEDTSTMDVYGNTSINAVVDENAEVAQYDAPLPPVQEETVSDDTVENMILQNMTYDTQDYQAPQESYENPEYNTEETYNYNNYQDNTYAQSEFASDSLPGPIDAIKPYQQEVAQEIEDAMQEERDKVFGSAEEEIALPEVPEVALYEPDYPTVQEEQPLSEPNYTEIPPVQEQMVYQEVTEEQTMEEPIYPEVPAVEITTPKEVYETAHPHDVELLDFDKAYDVRPTGKVEEEKDDEVYTLESDLKDYDSAYDVRPTGEPLEEKEESKEEVYKLESDLENYDKAYDVRPSEEKEEEQELVYVDAEPDKEEATRQLKELAYELEKAAEEEKERKELEEQTKAIEEEYNYEEREEEEEINTFPEEIVDQFKHLTPEVPTTSDQMNIDEYENAQEENAIISLDELVKKSEDLYASNELTQYEDEGDEPISLEDLERRKQQVMTPAEEEIELPQVAIEDNSQTSQMSFDEVVEEPKVEIPVVKQEAKVPPIELPPIIETPQVEVPPVVEIPEVPEEHHYEASPIISPVYGFSRDNSEAKEEKEKEERRTNFLNSLRELQENLNA